MIQNPKAKKRKNDEFYFYKNKKHSYGKKKKKISIVKDKVKKMFPTNGKKNCERF